MYSVCIYVYVVLSLYVLRIKLVFQEVLIMGICLECETFIMGVVYPNLFMCLSVRLSVRFFQNT